MNGIKPGLMANILRNNMFVEKFCHKGATAAHLKHYIDIALEKKPSHLIIHGGTNDIKGRNANSKTSDQIACDLIATAVKAREQGVQHIAISGVLITRDQHSNMRSTEINDILVDYCRAYNFGFIDNTNIQLEHLRLQDPVHLATNGLGKIVKNFSRFANNF